MWIERSREVIIKRCAIYTRKSAAETVERALSTLDAQRHLCESYVASQAGEGWVAIDERYDDGGFSGGSLDRPAVKRLRDDIAAGKVDVVVVYKIDRLSRSLIDFSRLMGDFEAKGVSFVSVTQAFNTSHSMGRLTLNVLLSFAQFERELASERLRDKAAASRAQGLWQNGQRPFGYRLEKGRLIVDPIEAETVRFVYRRYIQTRSSRLLAEELHHKGIKNKVGTNFTGTSIAKILRNRLYRGDLVHNGQPMPGVHEAIITESLWLNARKTVESIQQEKRTGLRSPLPHPFKGLIFGASGQLYSQNAHHNRYGQLFRYYLPSGRKRSGPERDWTQRFRADTFDDVVLNAIAAFVPLQDRDKDKTEKIKAVRSLISRIDIGDNTITIGLHSGAIVVADLVGRIRKTKPRYAVAPREQVSS